MNQIQSLLNDCLIKTKHVEHAAIIKLKDEIVWASTLGFNLQPQYALLLSSAFFKNLLHVRREGLYFKEKHYKCVRADECSIYLKNEDRGLIAVKTDSYILVATYSEGMYPSVCVEAVEKLGRRQCKYIYI
nr:profilin-4 isoform X2 [Chelonoidis abingdonii]